MSSSKGNLYGCSLGSRKFARLLLSGVALGALSVPAAAQQAQSELGIQEVVVTAQRRSENLQDVPIAVQALTGDTLQQLNVENFDDMTKQLPNVTVSSFGPGQSNIYMRGLSVGNTGGQQGSGGTGSFPNVAVYLDDQSAQVPGRNLDIYAVDLQRVEVLEGPQGTLFGSGAQAGVVRYITNKPDLDKLSAKVNAGAAGTVHGDMSENADGMLNVPLIPGTAALRVVIYDDSRGGYINNVPGTFVRHASDATYVPGYAQAISNSPGGIDSANNSSQVGNAINPVEYKGARAELAWKFNDEWDALLTQSFQQMDAQGVFYDTPFSSDGQKLPDLSVQLYNPSWDKDKFENTAWTVNGKIGDLSLVYDGAYLVRNVDQQQDYTNYSRGLYASYYQCLISGGKATQCYSPSAYWRDHEQDTHLSQEVRLSTPDDWRLRAVGGLFWEDFQVDETTDFFYGSPQTGFAQIAPPPGADVNNSAMRAPGDAFINDIKRGYTQEAAFASVDYDIIPKELTITAGTRLYRFDNWEKGAAGGGCVPYWGCSTVSPHYVTNLGDLKSSYTGAKSRANITWHVTPDAMVYYTFSQGFRPGGFNRLAKTTGAVLSPGDKWVTPLGFSPDTLMNNEVGFKTQWFNRRLELDGALYQEDWKHVQTYVFDPQASLGDVSFTSNAGDYRVRGVELQFTGRVTHELTLTGGGAINSSQATTSPALVGSDTLGHSGVPLPSNYASPFGSVGDSLALSPLFKGNLRARYEFEVGDYLPFFQIGVEHSSHTHSATGVYNNFIQAPVTMGDLSMGVAKDAWSIQAYCDNFTNTKGVQFISNSQWVKGYTVARPLTAGAKISYEF
jgi:outer membrane receptor protein involved in Fe transport